jgi:hypothetical protein
LYINWKSRRLFHFPRGFHKIGVSTDAITVEYRSRFPSANFHDHVFRDAALVHIARGRPSQIVEQEIRHPGFLAGNLPRATKVCDALTFAGKECILWLFTCGVLISLFGFFQVLAVNIGI